MAKGIATTADVRFWESKPLSKHNLPSSTYDAIKNSAEKSPDKIALQFFLQGNDFKNAVFYSFQDVLELLHQSANMFADLGIGQSDVVSLILPNLPQSYFAFFAGQAVGIANPISPLLEPSAMADMMNAVGTKVLVTLAPFPTSDVWQKVATIADQVPTLETILRVDMMNYLGFFTRSAIKLANLRRKKGPQVQNATVLDFGQTARQYDGVELRNGRDIQPTAIATIFHTDGTTGPPKLVPHTHFNELSNAWAIAKTLDIFAADTLFCGLPLFHAQGAILNGLMPWMNGAAVVLGTSQGYGSDELVAHFWQIVDYFKINIFSGVPAVFNSLLDVAADENDSSSVKFAICATSAMPHDLYHQFEAQTGIPILEMYNLTEAGCTVAINPLRGEQRLGSVGYRLPYQELKVVQLDATDRYVADCATGEEGAVIVRGPTVFGGYHNQTIAPTTWIDTGDGKGNWFNSGDLGRLDAEGYLWLTGRQTTQIKRAGITFSPQKIEAHLQAHPAVAVAAVVGKPDRQEGQIPIAFVQLQPEATATEEELLLYAQTAVLESVSIPQAIHIVDLMPYTAMGAIIKPQLLAH